MPPMPSTGSVVAARTLRMSVTPAAGPASSFVDVSYIGPAETYEAPAASAARASSALATDTPISAASPSSARASAGCMSSCPMCPTCTPLAPAANATSTRSFTTNGTPAARQISLSARARRTCSAVPRSFARSCTQVTPPRSAALTAATSPLLPRMPVSAMQYRRSAARRSAGACGALTTPARRGTRARTIQGPRRRRGGRRSRSGSDPQRRPPSDPARRRRRRR
jgi:hypothetical protein